LCHFLASSSGCTTVHFETLQLALEAVLSSVDIRDIWKLLSVAMADMKDPELAKNDLEVVSSTTSSKDAAAPIPREGETEHLPNFEHEKALCWKFDLRMLPMLALMYLFSKS
jgi:hypothetical protein